MICTVPVFNSTAHFLMENAADKLKAEEVITQRAKVDPTYNAEIPVGSLVAVHSTVSSWGKPPAKKSASFNLLAVQILALPLGG